MYTVEQREKNYIFLKELFKLRYQFGFLYLNLDRSKLFILALRKRFSVTADCYRRYTIIDSSLDIANFFFSNLGGGRFLIRPGRCKPDKRTVKQRQSTKFSFGLKRND